MSALPAVTIVVLNWNAAAYLEACLTSLLAQDYPDARVILVDNASADDSLDLVRARFPDLPLIAHGRNAGFAAGNNLALRNLKTPLAVLANPDIVVPPGWLRRLVAPFVADPRIGVAGCQTRYPDGTLQHAGGLLRPPLAIAAYRREDDPPDAVIDVDYVIGAALAVRREVLERIGLLDEGYFLYYEEADLCARVRRAGYRVVYVAGAQLTHVESATTPHGDATYLERLHTSRWRYVLKHTPVETLRRETIPAESAWLDGRNSVERRAAALAHLAALRRLPATLAARARDGAPALSPDEADRLGLALEALFARAWAGETSLPETLEARRDIREPAVAARWPWLARLKALWLDLAPRWYLRALWAQQNHTNRLLANQLAGQHARLRAGAADLAALARGIAELEAEIERERGAMKRGAMKRGAMKRGAV